VQVLALWVWWHQCWYVLSDFWFTFLTRCYLRKKNLSFCWIGVIPGNVPSEIHALHSHKDTQWCQSVLYIGVPWWKNHWSWSCPWHSYPSFPCSPERRWNQYKQYCLNLCVDKRTCTQVCMTIEYSSSTSVRCISSDSFVIWAYKFCNFQLSQ